jgi:glyoxylase-like metal-dependent hydrolase (beta-lactamase superfamily II)
MGGGYEVLAVRYGSLVSTRSRSFLNFHLYQEPDSEQRVDYFFWLIRDADRVIVVDTGFAPDAGRRRGRTAIGTPATMLPPLGIDPAIVSQVVVTHAHYDHIGNLAQFPSAEVIMTQAEYDFWTSPVAARDQFALFAEPAEIGYLESLRAQGRLTLFRGASSPAAGIELVEVGGHTPGQLIVLVSTAAGRAVLASDALHFYAEVERDWPFYIVADLPGMYRAYDLLGELAAEPRTGLVAGHDPEVRTRFAAYPGAENVTDVSCTRYPGTGLPSRYG